MPLDELREQEATRRKALWLHASFSPGDAKASDPLAILDDLDRQQLNENLLSDQPLEFEQLCYSVSVERHHSGIDIVVELNIPQPWRERFLQASIGSTRLVEGPYATGLEEILG
jgi:hypothetical protein